MAGFRFIPTAGNVAAAIMDRVAQAETMASAAQGMTTTQGRRIQGLQITVPALTVLVSTQDIPVTWPTPYADATYLVFAQPEAASVVLGKLAAGVKPGSQTKEGCVITVTSLGLAIPGGSLIDVLAIHA